MYWSSQTSATACMYRGNCNIIGKQWQVIRIKSFDICGYMARALKLSRIEN